MPSPHDTALTPLDVAVAALDREAARRAASPLARYFPDCTAECRDPDSPEPADHAGLCRNLYRRHVSFMNGGHEFLERMFIAGNRAGKTATAEYEVCTHLTGKYPKWWGGHVFEPEPARAASGTHIEAWAAGDTGRTVREIIQHGLIGDLRNPGGGMLTSEDIVHMTRRTGLGEAVDSIWVKHVEKHHGAHLTSHLELKAYDQRRESFQGVARHLIWLDEEPPADVYSECLLRTLPTGDFKGGKILLTFTPLMGLTDVVRMFLPEGLLPKEHGVAVNSGRLIVNIPWEEVPHLSAKERETYLDRVPEHEREARTKGVPILGSGRIFGYAEDAISVEPFPIPDTWPRGYGMDVGWNYTAAAFCAWDQESDTLYVYHCYKGSHLPPPLHAHHIKAIAKNWIPGRIDPAANTPSQKDGSTLFEAYRQEGLLIETSPNALEGGIRMLDARFATGRLKVFNTCSEFMAEYRQYHRKDGRPVAENDHILDSLRYCVNYGSNAFYWMETKPRPEEQWAVDDAGGSPDGWMAG